MKSILLSMRNFIYLERETMLRLESQDVYEIAKNLKILDGIY